MCDQSSVQYNDGDVVWVKLGPCWWPGEVHDIKRVPPEIQPGLKKPPIAFVHFFQEDKYEYVRSLDCIHHYNCRRKHEFIKKGLDMHRAKQKHMDKFPVDVCTAETLTNGDPDIITSEEFAPQQKVNYANLFGSPANRKSTSKRNSLGGSGSKPGRGRKSVTPKTLTSTPARFINTSLNYKKYEAHDLTKRDNTSLSPTIGDSSTNVTYSCDRCNYTCTRLNVITYHHKMHISEDNNGTSTSKGKKKSKSKISPQNKLSKISRCSTLTIDEDLELLKKGIDLSTYDYNKKKYKSPKIKFAKTLKLTEKKKNNKKDVKGISNLLADWDDSESEKEDDTVKSIDTSLNLTGVGELQTTQTEEVSKDATAEKSCFDFEEDEEVATIISKSPGRKIPRVIPENQKAKTPETILDISNDLSTESKSTPKEAEKTIKGKRNRKSKVEFEETKKEISDNTETIEKQFDQIMAETALPELNLLATESTPLFSETKTPDKKSRVRKKYELFSMDKSPVSSDSETLVKAEKKVRGRKKSEIPKTEINTEQESEKHMDKNLIDQNDHTLDKNKSETNYKESEQELNEPRTGKRKSEIKNIVLENLPVEMDQESHKKKPENVEKAFADIQPKNESTHATRGKRKSELISKDKILEDIEQVEPFTKKKDETKLFEITEQKEMRGRQKSESSSKEKVSSETSERKETRGRKKSLSPMKEMKVVEAPIVEQKESEQMSKKSRSDLKEKSPEVKLDKLFSEKPDKKVRGRKSIPVIDKSTESVVETIAYVSESSPIVDLGKKTRNSKKSETVEMEVSSPSEPLIEISSKKLLPKRRGLSTVIPKDFKDIYTKSDSSQNNVKDNEQIQEKSENLLKNIPEIETELSDSAKVKPDEGIQDVMELVQEKKTDSKADLTPKRSRRHTKGEIPQVEKETSKEEIKTDTVEEIVEIKVDKRSKRHKTEKIDELKLDFNAENVETKLENKRSRRSQKLTENLEDKTELKVDSQDESIESKSDNKRSRRSQKPSETSEEELKTGTTEERTAEDKLELKLDDNVEFKSDGKRLKRSLNKPVENLEEKPEELKKDTVDENKRSRRSNKLTETLSDKPEGLKTDNFDENKRSRRSHKSTENLEEKPEELKTDNVDENKRSRRSQKSVENLEEKPDDLKIDSIDENKRSRRLHKPTEIFEDKPEELKIDTSEEKKRSKRSQKSVENLDEKPNDLKIDSFDENKRSKKAHKPAENVEEKAEDLKIETIDEKKRSKKLQHKPSENLEEKSEELKIDTVDENKRSKRSHKPIENVEEKSEELKFDSGDENKRSRRSYKLSENLEEKPVELQTESVDENIRSRKSHKPVENLEEKPEELKIDSVDENKRSRRSHKSTEYLEEKPEELKTDSVDENKRSRRSHKFVENLEEKPEDLKIDSVEENKRSRRSHKPTEITEEKTENLKIEASNLDDELDNKRSRRSQKSSETVEELRIESIEEKNELKSDTKRSRRGAYKQSENEKIDEFKPELIEENKLDSKGSRNSSKSYEVVEEKTVDVAKDKIEVISTEIIETVEHKPDKRSRKQKMEVLKDDEPKTDDFGSTSVINQFDDNLDIVQKTKLDSPRKSKRNKADPIIVENLNESDLIIKDSTSLTKSPNKLETYIGSDLKRHKSPMKDVHKSDKNKAGTTDEFNKDMVEEVNKNDSDSKIDLDRPKLIVSPKKDETGKGKLIFSLKKDDTEKEKLILSPKKDETGKGKLILSLKKNDTDKKKLIISPKKDETDKGKLFLSPKKDETEKIDLIFSRKKDELPDNDVIEKPKERSRILRKRGRFSYSSPTHSTKELVVTDDISDKSTVNESFNVSAYTFQETTGLTDSLLNIKKPSFSYREASAKAALANENKLKEQNDKIYEKSFDEKSKDMKAPAKPEKEKSDDSVKVMISLNDFKMEDIPLPPTPSQSSSSPSKITSKDKRNQQEEKSDTSSNTSQELKRTPIKFEISKMKAQINKKILTHKSFLAADDDDEGSVFSRKIQPLHSESVSFKRTNDKECEAPPKKRVMADYKKELDMEKTKEREEQERKMQSENQLKEDKEIKITETTDSLDENKSTEGTDLNLISEVDTRENEEIVINKTDASTVVESENQDEEITTMPFKHEDISAVINSGSEVKIIDSNSDILEEKDKIVQQIVHELPIETTYAESILETLEGNGISTAPSEIDIALNETDTSPKNDKIDVIKDDENIKELQNDLESKDINETLLNELTKSDDQPHVAVIQEETNKAETSTNLPLTPDEKLDTPTKIVMTPDYVDELESIENEIQKITSSESSPCKANIFPENIALMSTPTKDNISLSDSLMDNKDLYAPQLSESEQNTSLLLSTETTKATDNENSIESEIAKLTDTKPEENEIIPEQSFSTTSSKLLEILESKGDKTKVEKKLVPVTLADRKQTFVGLTAAQKRTVSLGSKFVPPKATKFVIKTSSMSKDNSNATKKPKPIILSEEIIKPANNDLKTPPTKGVATKRNFEEDIEDKGGIKKFIIEKAVADSSTPSSNKASRIKPTVLSQTIITSTGKIIDGSLESNKESVDDNMFDINSMPIVLSDDLLTPESIENMPIVLSTEPEKSNTVQIMNKSGKVISEKMKIISQQKPMIKSVVHQGIAKNQKVYQTSSTKLLSNKTAVITQPGKPEKFIILPSSSASQTTGSKYTVGKRQIRTPGQSSIVVSKSMTGVPTSGTALDAKTKLQSGNKVMVVTNAQGQQSRIILSPAQQKMLGTKMGTKIVARGSPVTKGTTLSLNNIVTSKGAILTPTSTFVQTKTQTCSPQTVVTSKGQLLTSVHSQSIITSKGQILTPVTPTQMKAIKGGVVQGAKKIQLHSQKIIIPANTAQTKPTLQSIPGVKTKTVLVKGQRHIVQKVQPNTSTPPGQLRTVVQKSPALKTLSTPTVTSPVITGKQKLTIAPKTPNVIKRQVIRQQSTPSQQPQRIILQKMSSDIKTPIQRPTQQKLVEQKSFIKSTRSMPSPVITSSQSVPPLVPLSPSQPKTTDSTLSQNINIETTPSMSTGDTSVHSPKQLIIQDDMGNQTSITQGQILAVPGGEVVDGQPQSYMLVTVDESGNLLPLDNQALMALDPNLIGPDGNVMLQFNQGLNTSTSDTSTTLTPTTTDVLTSSTEHPEIPKKQSDILSDAASQDYQQLLITDDQQNLLALGTDQQLLMTDNQNLILADQTVLQDPKVTLPASDQAVTYSIANAEDGQQIFISGDPEKAQHLINALASGSQDLSQIMSNAEGNLIINADGQHIILNTDSAGAEQLILATSTDGFALSENYTPDFATQVTTNQDILAAALANTVFPPESAITEGLNIVTSATGGPLMSTASELSPSLYQNMQLPNLPSGAVLETSLTNLAPIMSPLEVPTSGTSKKVPLDIETTSQVPKSLELPITITDPNIAQTVNSQLANELQTNLGLPITITDPNISNVRNSELTTSTFGYSLPNIDDSIQVSGNSTAGPISMPLLTEDLESETTQLQKNQSAKNKDNEIETQPEELTNIFEPSKTNSRSNDNQIEEIENSGNGLDVLASVTTASGMINVTESNSELEHIFAEKKDDQQLPANVFAQNPSFDNDIDESKETNNENAMHQHPHDDEDSFSRSQLTDHFVLGSPHSEEIDANSDEISIQPSIVTEEGNNSNHSLSERSNNSLKRGFDGLEDDDECDDNKKSKFDIS